LDRGSNFDTIKHHNLFLIARQQHNRTGVSMRPPLFSWFGLSILCLALSCSSSKATDEQDSTDTIVLDVEDTDISKDASDSTIAKPDTPSPSDAQNDDTNLVEDAQDASPPDPDGAVDTNPPDVCQPDCTGKSCGGDGCGGNCGTCGDDETCEAGL
jgi:hypothetical protein